MSDYGSVAVEVNLDTRKALANYGSLAARILKPLGVPISAETDQFLSQVGGARGRAQRDLDSITGDRASDSLRRLGTTGSTELGKVDKAGRTAADSVSSIGAAAGDGVTKLGRLGNVSGETLLGVGAGLTAGGAKLTASLDQLVERASNLGETRSFAERVFGPDAEQQIERLADTAADKLGQSRQQVIEASTGFAIYGKSAGLAGDKLVGFSTDLLKLATDMASAKDTTIDQALEALSAGLRGESEPLRAYGILLDDATLRQTALALRITDTTSKALTPQQRVLAAHALILQQGSIYQGDFARTADSLANAQRRSAAEMENAKTEAGEGLVPAWKAANAAGRSMLEVFNELPAGAQAALGIGALALGLASQIGGVAIGITGVVRLLGDLRSRSTEALSTIEGVGSTGAAAVDEFVRGADGPLQDAQGRIVSATRAATGGVAETGRAAADSVSTTARAATTAAETAATTATATASRAAGAAQSVAAAGSAAAQTVAGAANAAALSVASIGTDVELFGGPGVIREEATEIEFLDSSASSAAPAVRRIGDTSATAASEVLELGTGARSAASEVDDLGNTAATSGAAGVSAFGRLGGAIRVAGAVLAGIGIVEGIATMANELRGLDAAAGAAMDGFVAHMEEGRASAIGYFDALASTEDASAGIGDLIKSIGTEFSLAGVTDVRDIEYFQQAFDKLNTRAPREQVRQFLDDLEAQNEQLDHSSTAYTETAKLIAAWRDRVNDAEAAQRKQTDITNDQTSALAGLGSGYQDATEELTRFGVTLDAQASKWQNYATLAGEIFDPVQGAISAQDALDAGNRRADDARAKLARLLRGDTEGVKSAEEALARARIDLAKAVEDNTERAVDAFERLQDARDRLADLEEKAGLQATSKVVQLGAKDVEAPRTARDIAAARRDVARAEQEYGKIATGQSDQIVSAKDRVTDAQRRLNDEMAKSRPTSEEVQAAIRDVADAESALPGLVLAVEQANARLRDEIERHPEAIQASVDMVTEWERRGLISAAVAERWRNALFQAAVNAKALVDTMTGLPETDANGNIKGGKNEGAALGPWNGSTISGGGGGGASSSKPPANLPKNTGASVPASTAGFPTNPRNNQTAVVAGHLWVYVSGPKQWINQGISRADGGPVPGTGNTDSVPAMLMPGEFVLRKAVAQQLGLDLLGRINRDGVTALAPPVAPGKDKVPRYAAGGPVGGTYWMERNPDLPGGWEVLGGPASTSAAATAGAVFLQPDPAGFVVAGNAGRWAVATPPPAAATAEVTRQAAVAPAPPAPQPTTPTSADGAGGLAAVGAAPSDLLAALVALTVEIRDFNTKPRTVNFRDLVQMTPRGPIEPGRSTEELAAATFGRP